MRSLTPLPDYEEVLGRIVGLLEGARRASARSVNSVMTATYWEIGRHIIEGEQKGEDRAEYGTRLLARLSEDLTARFGRGFGIINLRQMRRFYLNWPSTTIRQTPSDEFVSLSGKSTCDESNEISQTPSAKLARAFPQFPLPWSHYVRLLAVEESEAQAFYEALRGGWSVRQLDRQISSKFYERTLLSRNKAAMLRKGEKPLRADAVSPEAEIKDPLVL